MNFTFTVTEVLSILALVIAIFWPIFQWFFWVDKRLSEVDERLGTVDKRLSKIEDNYLLRASEEITKDYWWDILHRFEEERLSANPRQDMVRRREELTAKLKDGTITLEEAKELHNVLNKELEEAKDANDALAVLAILFLIGVVAAAIAAFLSK